MRMRRSRSSLTDSVKLLPGGNFAVASNSPDPRSVTRASYCTRSPMGMTSTVSACVCERVSSLAGLAANARTGRKSSRMARRRMAMTPSRHGRLETAVELEVDGQIEQHADRLPFSRRRLKLPLVYGVDGGF